MPETKEEYILENEKLRAENQKLKEREQQYLSLLSRNGIFVPDPNRKLTMDDRIRIFMDYFRTRTDLYSERYINQKTGKQGWNPACFRNFQDGCMKKHGKFQCFECPVSSFKPLNESVILAHFTGSDARGRKNYGIGLYPLFEDHTVCWLALDFDDDRWFEDMLSVYQTAIQYNIYPVMERSASGQGGHLWFFFSRNIPASTARMLGEHLLREAMKTNPHLNYSSFDRMFPNQDYVPKGGAGNLIAAPLRFEAYQNGNTAFINTRQQVIRQPFEYLSSKPKITPEEISSILSRREEDYFFDQDQLRLALDTHSKYSPEIHGTVSGRLIIEKKGLNALTLNLLKRTASMYNPKYFEMQKYHRPIYIGGNITKVLCYWEEDDRYLYLPRGLTDKLQSILPETKLILEDQTVTGHPIDISFHGELRADQKDAVQAMMKYDMGILKAVPGFGKTVIALNLMSEIRLNTLIVVEQKELLNQWEERISQWLTYPQPAKKKDRFVCKYSGTSKRRNGNIDIATAASLKNAENLDEIMSEYGMIIIDECHHIACDTFLQIMRHAKAKYIYGLSATPKRDDGLEKVIYMHCGPIRKQISGNEARKAYQFTQYLIPRFTNFRWLADDISYTDLCTELMKDPVRNNLILKDILAEYRNSGKIIVLSERVEHLNILFDMLSYACEDVYMLSGQTKMSERKATLDYIRNLKPENSYVLLATSKLLGEGFDLPSLQTLFLVLPISSETRITQYTGRIHRNMEGKDTVRVYDYVDEQVRMANNMYYKRLKQYQAEGYMLKETKEEVRIDQFLFDSTAFKDAVLNDISNAEHEVIIFSASPGIPSIRKYQSALQTVFHRGTAIRFIIPEKYRRKEQELRYLQGCGGNIIFADHRKHFVIIDRRIVWSGTIDLFKPVLKEEYLTRTENTDLVSEILGSLPGIKESTEEYNLFTVSE